MRRSVSNASEKPLTANFAALYAVWGPPRSSAKMPLMLLMLMMQASLLATSSGRKAREQL